jgi:hypothetical protein
MICKKVVFFFIVFFLIQSHNKVFAASLDVKDLSLSGSWILQVKDKGSSFLEIVESKNKKEWDLGEKYPLFEVKRQDALIGKVEKVEIISFFQKSSDKNQKYIVFYSYKFNNLFFENSFLITSLNYSSSHSKKTIIFKDEHSKLEYVLEKVN